MILKSDGVVHVTRRDMQLDALALQRSLSSSSLARDTPTRLGLVKAAPLRASALLLSLRHAAADASAPETMSPLNGPSCCHAAPHTLPRPHGPLRHLPGVFHRPR